MMSENHEKYCFEQAKQISSLLVKAKLITSEKEGPTAALLTESLRKRFKFAMEKLDRGTKGDK